MGGYPDGSFKPNDPVSREELAATIVRAYNLSGEATVKFSDIKSGSWSYGSVQTLVANKITTGYPDGTFKPKKSVTRAEFASFLTRTIKGSGNDNNDTSKGELTVSFLDVGQGDSILIQTPGGKSILYDGARRSAGEKIVSYLAKAGITSVDLLVASHPDADHIGGLINVMERMNVKKVLDSGKTHTSKTYMEFLTVIDEKNIPFEVAKAGEFIKLDSDIKIQVLNSTNTSNNTNDSSIVLKITHGQVSYLLTGDATVKNEREMIQKYNVSADILQVGHHGSDTSTSQEFVNAVMPKVAVLSYGEGNQYDHPKSAVVNRLTSSGAKLYHTATMGDIVVKSNGNTYTVITSK